MYRFIVSMLLAVLGCSCSEAPPVRYDSKVFRLENEGLTYNGKLFTGKLLKENTRTRRIEIYNSGQKDGHIEEFFQGSNRLSKSMHYKAGKPIGIHTGYRPSGAKHFEMQYKDGQYHGDVTYWYEDGSVYSYTYYQRGKVKGQKIWRKNGRIYANYIVKDGQKMGLTGGKLCLNIEDVQKL